MVMVRVLEDRRVDFVSGGMRARVLLQRHGELPATDIDSMHPLTIELVGGEPRVREEREVAR